MQERALILEAHYTTHIEGTQLTLEQSEQLLTGHSVPAANPDDVRELLNYRNAFDLVAGYLGSGDPITEGLIREIHKRLVKGVRGDKANPGNYRKVQNYVVSSKTGETIYTPPPAQEVQAMMTELVQWLNEDQEINAVLVAALAQFQLVHIHPFLDGNGRSARLLSTLSLYRKGYDFKRLFTISEYYDRDRTGYYQAIQGVRDDSMDMTGWLEYFVNGLATQMAEVQQRGKSVIKRDLCLANARKKGLKERVVTLLDFLLTQGKATVADCEKALAINRRTLQRDLKLLIEKGFIQEISTGPTDPTKHYEPLL